MAGGSRRRVAISRLLLTGPGVAGAQKNELKPWLKPQGCLPTVSGAFVAAMEEVLSLYGEPYDPKRPKVCFDDTSRQLLADTQSPLPVQPGRPGRIDDAYKRAGTRHLFRYCDPQAGWRHVAVTARRTTHDVAHQMPWLVDGRSPDADVIRVVLDTLNTHGPGALYEAFTPAEARRLVEKWAFHYTPKPGSWLNRAAIELSMLQRQCLQRRMADEGTLKREVAAWEHQRNTTKETMDWRFSITAAREKLKRLYPTNSVR